MIGCQLLLVWFLGREAFTDEANSETKDVFKKFPEGFDVVITRFLCAIFLHISLDLKFREAFSMMKYALNHPWKFRNWLDAYFIGLAQLLVVLSVEGINLALLNTNTNVMDILMNFLALIIIAEFDESFYLTTAGEPIAELINEGEYKYTKKDGEGIENKTIELEEVFKQ